MCYLSLTLRDVQHLCWKTFKKLEIKKEKPTTAINIALELVKRAETVLSKLQNTNGGDSTLVQKEALQKLFSELLYLTFVLAENSSVNLEESFLQTIDEYILGSIN